MHALILETDVLGPSSQSRYGDSLTSYQFPIRYLRYFSPLSEGTDILAIVYEPRGQPPRGRMAYVGWTILSGLPYKDPSVSGNLFKVEYLYPLRSFEQPVPREINGKPLERWLRDYPRGRARNTATRGRAVRRLTADEAETIMLFGSADIAWDALEESSDHTYVTNPSDSRVREVVTRLERCDRFRKDVLLAYDNRCAVSGLSADGVEGLIEAAHIRGAGRPENGPDHITNGIALTPTLHRLFDRHLFSLQYSGNELVVVTSSQLSTSMLRDSITGSWLKVNTGQQVLLPTRASSCPSREYIDYHRSRLRS